MWLKQIPSSGLRRAGLVLLSLLCVVLFNETLFLWLNHAGRVMPDKFWALLSYFGDGLTAFVMLLLFARRYPRLLSTGLIAVVVSLLISQGLKHLFSVARPLAVLPEDAVHIIGIDIRNMNSFPSGHALTGFLFAGLLLPYLQTVNTRRLLLGFASLIALSRVMVGAHWPLDVLAGAFTGLFSAWLSHYIASYWQPGRSLLTHISLIGFYLLLASYLPGYTGGFQDLQWPGWMFGSLLISVGIAEYLEYYFHPEQFEKRLQQAFA